MAEVRDNSGTLSRNINAITDRHPTHKGRAVIDGKSYWISAWIKEGGPSSKSPGQKFFSLAFDPIESGGYQDSPRTPNAKTTKPAPPPSKQDWDDKIPF